MPAARRRTQELGSSPDRGYELSAIQGLGPCVRLRARSLSAKVSPDSLASKRPLRLDSSATPPMSRFDSHSTRRHSPHSVLAVPRQLVTTMESACFIEARARGSPQCRLGGSNAYSSVVRTPLAAPGGPRQQSAPRASRPQNGAKPRVSWWRRAGSNRRHADSQSPSSCPRHGAAAWERYRDSHLTRQRRSPRTVES
jgi:hypothetical protein